VSGTEIRAPGSPGDNGAPAVPGLYGKLPARGDFLSRRLDAQFVAAWDEWLQAVMRESRERLGERWLECFLSMPVWRFALPAGMYSAAGWVGLMVPSVDRVGRYFPLTIAASIPKYGLDVPATLARALPWLASVEALALGALRPELDFDLFDQQLAGLQLPAGVASLAPLNDLNDDTIPLGMPQAMFQVLQLASPAAPALNAVLDRGLPGARQSAVWVSDGGETQAACLAVCGGPIPGERFCALLDGAWQAHAWTLAPSIDVASNTDVKYCAAQNPGVRLDSRSGQGAGEGAGVGESGPLIAPPGSADGADMNTGLEK
jgi:type VI secretion system protein ImpM